MTKSKFTSAGGIHVSRHEEEIAYEGAIEGLIDGFDTRRGALFSSNYEYPGRYTQWDTAVIDPPVVITSVARDMKIEALNARGQILVPIIQAAISNLKEVENLQKINNGISLSVSQPDRIYTEEERSRMPTVFTVLRAIVDLFKSDEDSNLGLYGAFGYDLTFQFDPIELKQKRPTDQRDMVLFLPDQLVVVDHYSVAAQKLYFDFSKDGSSTEGLERDNPEQDFVAATHEFPAGDHEPGEYARLVDKAKISFAKGDLFEVVPGQVFYERCEQNPSAIFRRLRSINPSPYSFFINLGEGEYLVGASPEMFVRVTGRRVETCPISGTIPRGEDAIEDSAQILKIT